VFALAGKGSTLSHRTRMVGMRRGLGVFVLVAGLALWATRPSEARAQCGDNPPQSSCYACHANAYPVYQQGEWHRIHARLDCCWNCHGGNTQTQDQDRAHVGLIRQPLEDTYTSCHTCHPEDYRQRAEQFASVLGVTPVSSEPLTLPMASLAPGGGGPIVWPSAPAEPTKPMPSYWPQAGWPLALAALSLLSLLLWRRRRQT